MRRNLFWLNAEQWLRTELFLPTDVRGEDRVNDRLRWLHFDEQTCHVDGPLPS